MEIKLRLIGKKGFSLVEITVALAIGAIGLLALSGIIVYTVNSNRYATDISIATALARQKIEQIKLTEYNYVVDQTEYNLDQNGSQVTSGRYSRVTDVRENEAGFNTKTVDVTVYFSPTMEDTVKKAIVSTIIYP
jgi:uncharacterized protein (TIGR02598 family)